MNSGFKNTQIGIVPINWNTKTLEEINNPNFTISYGVVQPGPEDDNGVFFIRGGDIKNGKIGNKLRTISRSVSDSYSRTLLQGGEIVISLVGYPGECAVVPKSLSGVNIARQVGVIRINEENDKNFIQQYLSSTIGKKNLLGNLVGSAQQVINLNMLRKVYIPIPSLPEQQKIADILSTVDAKIEVIDQKITETEELKKGLMQRLLTKGIGHTEFKGSPLGEIPKSWEVVKLGNVVSKVGSGITPKGGREAYLEKGITFIRSQNVLRGSLKLVDVAFISEKQHKKMGNSKLRPYDVLLNITGASIGRSCVIPVDFKEGNVNQHVCIIRTKTELNASFLSQLLNSPYGMNQIDKFQAGGNREGLNFQQIRSFDIPLPPLAEQVKIGSLIVLIENKIEILSEKKTHHQELKQGLMQQLLTGKIRVNNLVEA